MDLDLGKIVIWMVNPLRKILEVVGHSLLINIWYQKQDNTSYIVVILSGQLASCSSFTTIFIYCINRY